MAVTVAVCVASKLWVRRWLINFFGFGVVTVSTQWVCCGAFVARGLIVSGRFLRIFFAMFVRAVILDFG